MAGDLARARDPWESWAQHALPTLTSVLNTDVTALYQLGRDDERIVLERFSSFGLDRAAQQSLRPCLEVRLDDRWGFFSPLKPEPRQRNRVLTRHDLRALQPSADESSVLQTWTRDVGLTHCEQLRVLLCAGPRLLGWLGVLRPRPFTARDRAVLRTVMAPVREALLRAEQWEQGQLALRVLQPTLEAIAAPAFVLDRRGNPLYANASGVSALRLDRALEGELREAVLRPGNPTRLAVTNLAEPGVPPYHLAVVRLQPTDSTVKVARFAAEWKLTPREAQVLGLLANGHANKAIAVTLGCAVATVEIHVSRVLEKSQCDSRAAVAARFWQPG